MRRKPRERDVEIRAQHMRDNQTWNDCPECGRHWQTIPPIPGLIHRTRLCNACLQKGTGSKTTHSSIM